MNSFIGKHQSIQKIIGDSFVERSILYCMNYWHIFVASEMF